MRNSDNNFSYLLVALMVFLIGIPAAIDLQLFSLVVLRVIGISSLLLIGIWSLKSSGRIFLIAMTLAAIGITLSVLDASAHRATYYVSANLATLAFLVLATVAAFSQIAASNVIDGNRIIGAICVYLMLGVIWSVCYGLLEFALPGSFSGITSDAAAWNPDWVYYSFVTLTTVGYGDFLPVSSLARALASLEAIVGQFYIAVLVAGLVSAYISEKQSTSAE